jgi:hypothetical protein
MPSSIATIADPQSDVAVHPIWILFWAKPGSANKSTAIAATANNLVISRLPGANIWHRLLFIDIFNDHIF